ncbi:MAG: hypothetical protein OT477_11300 [Chloroflexi bacterium]|nr:hypothetical protein [Chloroflexota bacterium]
MSENITTFAEPIAPNAGGGFIGRFIASLFIIPLTMVISAAAWGALAYYTNSVYMVAAIVIGFAVSFAVTYPFERIGFFLALLLFFPVVLLSAVTVLLGDYIFYVLVIIAEEGVTASEAIYGVAEIFVEVARQDSAGSLVFGIIGAVIGFYNAVRN